MQEPKKVQFDIENTTNEPISINLFDSSSITPISNSSSFSTSNNNVNISGGGLLGYNVYDTTSNLITFQLGNAQLGFFNPQTGKMSNGNVVESGNVNNFNPTQATITAPNGLFYCADDDNSLVRVIDSATNIIISSIPVTGFTIFSLYCSYNNLAYFTVQSGYYVNLIDTITNTLLVTLDLSTLPNITTLGRIAFNPNNNKIYISSNSFGGYNYTFIIDADTNAFSQDDLGTTDLRSDCIVVNPNNNSLYFATYDGANTNLSVYNCSTNTLVDTIFLFIGGFSLDDNGVYCPVNNCVYFYSLNGNNVYVVDCSTNTLVDTIAITSLNTISYGIVYSSIDNSVYIPTASTNTNYFDGLSKIDCSTNTLSNITLNTTTSLLINSAQNTRNGNIYVYSEIEDVISVFNSTGTFIQNITGIGSFGQGNRSAIIYIEFFDIIICYTDNGLEFIGCTENYKFRTIAITHNTDYSYDLRYDNLSGLLYVISFNGSTLIKKINLFTFPNTLENVDISNTNSSSLITKTDNIYSNFNNKNYLQVTLPSSSDLPANFFVVNGNLYGLGTSNIPSLFRYNTESLIFDRNQLLNDYNTFDSWYSTSNNKIYSTSSDAGGTSFLYKINSESFLVEKTICLSQFNNLTNTYRISYPIPQKNILVLTSLNIIFILNLETLEILQEIDYNSLGYLQDIQSVSYSTQDEKIIVSNGGQKYFFINANTYSVSAEYSYGTPLWYLNYCPINNQFYGYDNALNQVVVIDSNLETVTSTIPIASNVNTYYNNSNLIYVPTNNLIYLVGYDGIGNGQIFYIDPLTNTNIFTDTLSQLPNTSTVAYDSLTNSVYIGGEPSTNSSILNVTCVNPLLETPVYTPIVTESKVLETTNNIIQGMTTSSLNGYTYISSDSQNTISVFDENNLFVTEISILNPYKLIYVESLNYVYVIQPQAPTTDISVIDCNTNTILNTFTLSDSPQDLLFNESDGKVYISCDNNLIRINNDLTSPTPYVYASIVGQSAVALNTLNNYIYISGSATDTLFIFNCNTLSFITPLTIVGNIISNPNLIFNSSNNYLYTFDGNTNFYTIDTLTGTLVSNNEFDGNIAYSNYNLYSSVLTNDNYIIFSYINSTTYYYSFLLFFNCSTNTFEYSRFIESVATGTNLNITRRTGVVNGITFSNYDNSLRILSGVNNYVGGSDLENTLTLMSLSKQQTTYNAISIASETNISINEIDTDFNYGTGTNAGSIYTSVVLNDDSIYYGGSFSEWNGTVCGNIVRVLSDGSFDSSFVQGTGFNNNVQIIKKQSDSKIIVGGMFTSYNGNPCNRICRLNSDGSFDSTFNIGTGFNSTVEDLIILPSGKIICVGLFSNFNSNLSDGIASLNSDGSFDSTFNTGTGFSIGFFTSVDAISLQSDGKIICGGVFFDYNGNSCNNICRLNSDGSFDSTFNTGTGFNNQVLTIYTKADDKILVGGLFTQFDTNTITYYVQLNSDGSFDSIFNLSNVSSSVYSFNVDSNGLIYVGGFFNTFGSISTDGYAVLFQSGIENNFIDYSLLPVGNKYTISITLDNKIYLSGGNGVSVRLINDYTYNSLSVNQKENISSFDSPTQFILNNNGKLLIGGDFANYGNINSAGLIQLNLNGTYDDTFNVGTGVTGTLYDCKKQSDGKLIVVGNFSSYDGNSCGFICRLNTDGSFDNTFITGTGFDLFTYTLDIQSDDKIIVGGVFGFYDGNVCDRICRLNSDGSFDNTFVTGTGFDDTVKTLQIYNDKIYIGGSFVVYDGNPCNKICRLNLDGSFDSTFNIGTGFDDIIFKINVVNDKVYVVGQMTTYQGSTINRFVRLNLDGSFDYTLSTKNSLGNGFNGTVTCVYVSSDNKIYLGGLFTTYMGVSTENFVCLDTNGNILKVFSFTASQGFNGEVLCISQIDNNILVGGDFTGFDVYSAGYFLELNADSNIINDLYEIDTISNIFWNGTQLNPISYYTYQGQNQFGNIFNNYLNSYLYVSFVNSNLIQVLDINNNYSLVTTLTLPVSGNVIDFALNPENNTFAIGTSTYSYNTVDDYYTPNYGLQTSGGIVVFNSETNTISQTLNTFNNAGITFLTYSPTTGNFVYGGVLYSNSNSTFISYVSPSSSFTISGGSVNYNFFCQGLNNDPKKIEEIELLMPQRYLANPVNVQYKDASGISDLKPYLPNIEIDTFQKATNRAIVKFGDEYVMNINTQIVDFVLPPLSTTILVITYTELLKSDMLDVVLYDEERKAKYKINQSLDGKITAKKYWGNKKMPKELSLNSDWLKEMRERFQKVEVIEYDQPKLAGGTIQTREVYQDLFGFSKQVKAKKIGITKTPKFKKGVKVKLATKKKPIKPVAESVQVEEVFQDILRVNAHEIPLEKITPMEMPIDKQPIKPKPVEMTMEQVFQEMLSVNAHEIKLNRIKVPKIKGVKPIQVQLEDLSPMDVFNRSFEDYGSGYLVGVKNPCVEEEKKDKFDYGVYYIKPNDKRYTAFRHSGDFPIKIELTTDWFNDLKRKFDDIQVIAIVKKRR